MTNLIDESLFRAHFDEAVHKYKEYMKRMAAGRKRTIPVWLHLFENFTVNVMPIGVDDNKFGRYNT